MPVRIVSDADIQKEEAAANGTEVTVDVIRPDNIIEEKTDSWVVEKKELTPFETDETDSTDPPVEPKSKLFPDNIPLWVWIAIGVLIVGGAGGVIYFLNKKPIKKK